MVADFRRRFWISLVLTIPILALSPRSGALISGAPMGVTQKKKPTNRWAFGYSEYLPASHSNAKPMPGIPGNRTGVVSRSIPVRLIQAVFPDNFLHRGIIPTGEITRFLNGQPGSKNLWFDNFTL
jgi:hypothetical protein